MTNFNMLNNAITTKHLQLIWGQNFANNCSLAKKALVWLGLNEILTNRQHNVEIVDEIKSITEPTTANTHVNNHNGSDKSDGLGDNIVNPKADTVKTSFNTNLAVDDNKPELLYVNHQDLLNFINKLVELGQMLSEDQGAKNDHYAFVNHKEEAKLQRKTLTEDPQFKEALFKKSHPLHKEAITKLSELNRKIAN